MRRSILANPLGKFDPPKSIVESLRAFWASQLWLFYRSTFFLNGGDMGGLGIDKTKMADGCDDNF